MNYQVLHPDHTIICSLCDNDAAVFSLEFKDYLCCDCHVETDIAAGDVENIHEWLDVFEQEMHEEEDQIAGASWQQETYWDHLRSRRFGKRGRRGQT